MAVSLLLRHNNCTQIRYDILLYCHPFVKTQQRLEEMHPSCCDTNDKGWQL